MLSNTIIEDIQGFIEELKSLNEAEHIELALQAYFFETGCTIGGRGLQTKVQELIHFRRVIHWWWPQFY